MAKTIEHVHWPDAPDMWMPYAPAIKVKSGSHTINAPIDMPVTETTAYCIQL